MKKLNPFFFYILLDFVSGYHSSILKLNREYKVFEIPIGCLMKLINSFLVFTIMAVIHILVCA
jgi:hypothetical protein